MTKADEQFLIKKLNMITFEDNATPPEMRPERTLEDFNGMILKIHISELFQIFDELLKTK
jgi:hypothetical protein